MWRHHIRSELVGYKLYLRSTGSAGQVQRSYGDSDYRLKLGRWHIHGGAWNPACPLCCSVHYVVPFTMLFCSLCCSVHYVVLFTMLFRPLCCSVHYVVPSTMLFCSLCCFVRWCLLAHRFVRRVTHGSRKPVTEKSLLTHAARLFPLTGLLSWVTWSITHLLSQVADMRTQYI